MEKTVWIDSKLKEITNEQKESLISLLCKRRGAKKASRIRSLVTYDFLAISPLLSRFYFEGEVAHYVAGQSYREELTRIVNEIVRRFP